MARIGPSPMRRAMTGLASRQVWAVVQAAVIQTGIWLTELEAKRVPTVARSRSEGVCADASEGQPRRAARSTSRRLERIDLVQECLWCPLELCGTFGLLRRRKLLHPIVCQGLDVHGHTRIPCRHERKAQKLTRRQGDREIGHHRLLTRGGRCLIVVNDRANHAGRERPAAAVAGEAHGRRGGVVVHPRYRQRGRGRQRRERAEAGRIPCHPGIHRGAPRDRGRDPTTHGQPRAGGRIGGRRVTRFCCGEGVGPGVGGLGWKITGPPALAPRLRPPAMVRFPPTPSDVMRSGPLNIWLVTPSLSLPTCSAEAESRPNCTSTVTKLPSASDHPKLLLVCRVSVPEIPIRDVESLEKPTPGAVTNANPGAAGVPFPTRRLIDRKSVV